MSTTGALIAVATECGGAAASLNEYKIANARFQLLWLRKGGKGRSRHW
jgi:hypothetical protein